MGLCRGDLGDSITGKGGQVNGVGAAKSLYKADERFRRDIVACRVLFAAPTSFAGD